MKRAPGLSGYTMPAEWSKHRATWIAFPHHRTDFPGKLSAVGWTFAEMVRVLSQAEEVQVLVESASEEARARMMFENAGAVMARVGFVRAKTNRSWTRDTMPIWVKKRQKGKVAVNFRFDGWSRYRDHKHDDSAGITVARRSLSLRHAEDVWSPALPNGSRAVLEGGSIDVDEFGTLLTTSECLLTSKRARYGKWGQETCEQILRESLGVKKVLWLESGIAGDDTSGHIDDFARFAPGGKVLISSEVVRKDPNFAPLERAERTLRTFTNAQGKRLEVIPLPMPKPVYYRGERLPASYANFYIGNAAVLVPVFNDPSDRIALETIEAAFPDRPTVGIYARDLVVGLGTLHCSTMQEPL
jgi:agmatine deiminase